MKNAAIGFSIMFFVMLGLYFFWHKPELKNEYERGLESCIQNTDTLFIKGDPVIKYEDRIVYVTKESDVKISGDTITANFDSTFVSGSDSIRLKASVVIADSNSANWIIDIQHRDYELSRVDTVKIFTPRFIEVVVTEKDWLFTTIAYVTGVISAAVLFFLAR